MDLHELMPDNATLSKMLSEVGAVSAVQVGSKVREIEDPLTWAFYFLALLAVSVEDPKAKEMMVSVIVSPFAPLMCVCLPSLLDKKSLPNRFLPRTVFLSFLQQIPTMMHECVRMRSRIT